MRASGRLVRKMVRENSFGQTGKYTRESSKTMSAMATEFCIILTGRDSREFGETERSMARRSIFGQMVLATTFTISMARSRAKACSKERMSLWSNLKRTITHLLRNRWQESNYST